MSTHKLRVFPSLLRKKKILCTVCRDPRRKVGAQRPQSVCHDAVDSNAVSHITRDSNASLCILRPLNTGQHPLSLTELRCAAQGGDDEERKAIKTQESLSSSGQTNKQTKDSVLSGQPRSPRSTARARSYRDGVQKREARPNTKKAAPARPLGVCVWIEGWVVHWALRFDAAKLNV